MFKTKEKCTEIGKIGVGLRVEIPTLPCSLTGEDRDILPICFQPPEWEKTDRASHHISYHIYLLSQKTLNLRPQSRKLLFVCLVTVKSD